MEFSISAVASLMDEFVILAEYEALPEGPHLTTYSGFKFWRGHRVKIEDDYEQFTIDIDFDESLRNANVMYLRSSAKVRVCGQIDVEVKPQYDLACHLVNVMRQAAVETKVSQPKAMLLFNQLANKLEEIV